MPDKNHKKKISCLLTVVHRWRFLSSDRRCKCKQARVNFTHVDVTKLSEVQKYRGVGQVLYYSKMLFSLFTNEIYIFTLIGN